MKDEEVVEGEVVKKRGWKKLVVVAVVLALLAGGLVFAVLRSPKSATKAPTTPTLVPAEAVAVEATPTPTVATKAVTLAPTEMPKAAAKAAPVKSCTFNPFTYEDSLYHNGDVFVKDGVKAVCEEGVWKLTYRVTSVAPTAKSTVAAVKLTTTAAKAKATPQPQQPHPSLYVETGVGNTNDWNFKLKAGEVLIIGGWKVDNQSDGVYRAIKGPAEITTTVTDGFAVVVQSKWAYPEFCRRVKMAENNGWAHKHVQGLSGWNCDKK